MDFKVFLILYAISLPLFLLFDFVWLGVLAKNFYRNQLSHILGEMNWVAVVAFYVVFLLGLTFFAIYPTATRGTMLTGIILGGLFGFFTYATYDLTNKATLKGWPLSLTIVDILWGTFMGAVVTALTFQIYSQLFS